MKAAKLERPKWGAVVLVCKACGKRSSGPRDLKTKELTNVARKHANWPGVRTRVLATGCLGLCPKRATAVAFAGNGLAARIVAVRSTTQLEDAMARLVAGPDTAPAAAE